jgi:hypothetical protein
MQAMQQRACLTMELVVTARYPHAADYARLTALTASARRIDEQREGAAGAAASNRQPGQLCRSASDGKEVDVSSNIAGWSLCRTPS